MVLINQAMIVFISQTLGTILSMKNTVLFGVMSSNLAVQGNQEVNKLSTTMINETGCNKTLKNLKSKRLGANVIIVKSSILVVITHK